VLVTGKTQVAPKVKITIPRMELVAAVNSVRLARKVREALKIPLSGTRYFTDSSAVLGMLRTESGKFLEFMGERVSEVKVNSDVENEWRWLEGNCNPADLGTRSKATPQDMIFGFGVPGGDTLDDGARRLLAMQEVLQSCASGGAQEGHEGRSVLRGKQGRNLGP
jgi:hypothetical protein